MRVPSRIATSRVATLQFRYIAVSILLAVLFFAPLARAATPISQGYTTGDDVAIGSLVSLIPDSSDTVQAATVDNTNNLLGVVVSDNSSALVFGNGSSSEVQVATGGSMTVLASDINGDIKEGDQVTASPIAGVGMKVSTNAKVIGVAQADMTVTTEQTVDQNGTPTTVKLGSVPVLINVSYHYQTPERTLIPAAIQNIANAVAGRSVEPLPIILSAVIFIIMLVVVMIIIFSMIRSSIISVGRNPLSQSAVYRDVVQLSAVIIVIIAASIAAIYFILRTM